MTAISSAGDRKHRRGSKVPLLPQKRDDRDYDDCQSAEVGFDGASFSGAVFNLSTTIVGAGIMALPAILNQLGLIPGLLMILLGAWVTELSIDLVLRFGRASKTSTSYSGVVADAFGGFARTLLQVCIVVNNLGMLIVYLIIIDSLRYTSALSVLLAVVFVVITAGVAIVKLAEGSIGMPRLMPQVKDQADFWKLFTTVPVIVTAYICHHNVHPIENELKDPSQMKPIVRASLTLCSSVYIATSFFGVLLFGDKIMDDVLTNFDGDLGIPYSSLIDDIVRISYGVHLMLVFPIVFYSLRLNLDGLFFPYAIPISRDNKRFFSITIALMGFIFVGANFVPNIWDAFQFTGATAAVAVGFIFPAAIALRNAHGIATKRDRVAAWLMLFLAVTTSTVAICSDVYSILSPDSDITS
ncbi:unnamed protein product [Linum tenue]|uniref:Amino acid transporter transmembrane domain-containing protein n=1 Tax=Linum tenue TaxID=586396 RepID=A0AAV0P197_9ROSI|nr:unnamed protein product [Linum tenue]